ncbi:MAG: site-specific integrase [Candidatus Izimaplasma sp.]|nr:site-specific integrase [Candidatus Izimaplasma bacterium]
MTIKQAVPELLEHIKAYRSKASYEFYTQYTGYLKHYIGNRELDTLTKKDITYLINQKRKDSPQISNATLNKFITVLKRLYKYHFERPLKFERLNEKTTPIETVPKKVKEKIFNYYEKNLHKKYHFRNYVYIRLLYDTGLRMNELNNIRLRNIDFKNNVILVTVTKTDRDRYVIFSKETAQYLKKFITIHVNSDFIFYDFNNGNKLSTSAVESFISRLKKRLNIKKSISPHKWRHTFGTNFAKNGGNLEALRNLMGHTNLKTTQRYLHLNKEDLLNFYNQVYS